MFYVPPHVVLEPGSHHTEECYVILRGRGTMTLNGERREVSAGTFIHLPPWCEHGVENTGDETLEILICNVAAQSIEPYFLACWGNNSSDGQ